MKRTELKKGTRTKMKLRWNNACPSTAPAPPALIPNDLDPCVARHRRRWTASLLMFRILVCASLLYTALFSAAVCGFHAQLTWTQTGFDWTGFDWTDRPEGKTGEDRDGGNSNSNTRQDFGFITMPKR